MSARRKVAIWLAGSAVGWALLLGVGHAVAVGVNLVGGAL